MIHEKKNMERRKMESLGKKRKYCRFHPKIEIDLASVSKKFKADSSTISNSNSSLINGILSLSPVPKQNALAKVNES